MSIPETVLVFVGSPALIVAVVTALVLGPSELRKPTRYRPGRQWPHKPAWYLPHEIATGDRSQDGSPRESQRSQRALANGRAPESRTASAAGGASGEW